MREGNGTDPLMNGLFGSDGGVGSVSNNPLAVPRLNVLFLPSMIVGSGTTAQVYRSR